MNSGSHPLRWWLLVAAALLLLLGGCSAAHIYQSPALQQAREYNRRGVDAEARGQQGRAQVEFAAALRQSASIEDVEGVTTALVNLARLARRDGALERGRDFMNQALAKVDPESSLAGEVAFEQTLQLLARGDAAAAESWARQSLASSSRAQRAARSNLLARALWRLQRPAEAAVSCRQALAVVDADSDPAEAANAHRLLAEIAAAAGLSASAEVSYRQALTLDRQAGLSARIARDLRGLTELAVAAGQIQAATGLLQRAFEVALNNGDTAAAGADLERLATLYRQSGDPVRAAQVEAQRAGLLPTPPGT